MRGFRRAEFRHRRLERGRAPTLPRVRRLHRQHARRLEIGRAVGEHPLDGLVVARLAGRTPRAVLACAIAASRAASPTPSACAAIATRPPSSAHIAIGIRRPGAEHGLRSDPHVTSLEIHATETADAERILAHHACDTWRVEWNEKRADVRPEPRRTPGRSDRQTQSRPRPPPHWRPTLSCP